MLTAANTHHIKLTHAHRVYCYIISSFFCLAASYILSSATPYFPSDSGMKEPVVGDLQSISLS